MFNRILIKRRVSSEKFQTRWYGPWYNRPPGYFLTPSPHPVNSFLNALHKSLLNCHLVAALPAGCPTWTHMFFLRHLRCAEEQTGCFPQEWIKTGGAASHACTRKEKHRLPTLKNKTTTKQSKIPRGQKEVLCCPLSDRIESPNHKYPKKNKGRKGERKRDG